MSKKGKTRRMNIGINARVRMMTQMRARRAIIRATGNRKNVTITLQ